MFVKQTSVKLIEHYASLSLAVLAYTLAILRPWKMVKETMLNLYRTLY